MKRRSFGVNLGVSVANVVAVVGVSLAVVPLLIDRLGLQGYGLWVLAQSVVIYVTAAENGFGPALARFTSVHGHHPRHVRPMLALALVLYAAVGAVVLLACHVLAVPLVDAFDVPRAYHADAVHTVHLLGWVALVALLAAGLGHVMDGLERFTAYTITNALGSAAFLIWLLASDRGLQLSDVAIAALIQWSLVGLLRLVALRDVILARGSLIPSRTLVREIFGFSMRLQVAVMATLLNTQTDRVVIGIVSSAKTLGQVGIATQVAEAGRFLAYATFTPLAARLATAYGTGGLPALDALLHRYRRLWTLGVLGVLAVGVGAARPAITAWVGGGHDEASVYARAARRLRRRAAPEPGVRLPARSGAPGSKGCSAWSRSPSTSPRPSSWAHGRRRRRHRRHDRRHLATTVWIMRRVRGEVPSLAGRDARMARGGRRPGHRRLHLPRGAGAARGPAAPGRVRRDRARGHRRGGRVRRRRRAGRRGTARTSAGSPLLDSPRMAETSLRSRILANRRVLRTAQKARDVITYVTTPTPELRAWKRDDLYRKLQLTYDLDAGSTVLDVGGFKGQWASDIVAMYNCRVEVFEPVPEYRAASRSASRATRWSPSTRRPRGRDAQRRARRLGDASSHARADAPVEDGIAIELRSAAEVFAELPDGRVDLMKVNIEGAEYELLESLVETGLITQVRDLQVQFHRFVPDAERRMLALARLERTHEATYQYDFLWENWRRR